MARQLGRQAAETVSLERRLSRVMRCSDHRIILRWAMPFGSTKYYRYRHLSYRDKKLAAKRIFVVPVESSGLVKYTNKA
jgi:hypothetical protein